MNTAGDAAIQKEPTETPFGAILRETISEMESAAAADLIFDDVIQRLSLAAHHAITSQAGGMLPRVGGYAYQTSTVTPPAKTQSLLDVRF